MQNIQDVEKIIDHTRDEALGGALTLAQPKDGFRFGTDSILAAAAVPVQPGQSVLDLGTGCGVIAACLARRAPNIHVTAVDKVSDMTSLAARNLSNNGLADQCRVITADIETDGLPVPDHSFDHVVFNPPYFPPDRNQMAPDEAKAMARQGSAQGLEPWFRCARRYAKAQGMITMVMRASALPDLLKYMGQGAGGIEVFPFWPRDGHPAKTVVLRGRMGSKAPLTLHAGLTLHTSSGQQTPAAVDILKTGLSLDAVIERENG